MGVLQLGVVLLAGWTWTVLLWWGGLWLGTGGLIVGLVWGLARLTPDREDSTP